MELRHQYSPWSIEDQVIELFEEYEDGEQDEDLVNDILQTLANWIRNYHLFKLNRQEINKELQQPFRQPQFWIRGLENFMVGLFFLS